MLDVASLTAGYNGMTAISEVDMHIGVGEIVAVLGANGSGKSTLLKNIGGMEKPTSGTIRFGADQIAGLKSHEIARMGVALVPEGRRLFPRLSVEDNLRLGSYMHRHKSDREEPLSGVFDLFPRVQERLRQRAETLSGGEQQMLAIGRALMTRPRFLMLDEPSQGIMPKLVDEIMEAIVKIRARGVTVLIVEQRLAETLEIADRSYVLQTGRIVMKGNACDVAKSDEVRRAYLGI